jgi:methylmalonyl-CoA mutase
VQPAAIPTVPLAADFEAPSSETWRRLVEKSLKGADPSGLISRTYDEIEIAPLYPVEGAAPLRPARAASGDPERPWDLRAAVDHPDPARANAVSLKELAGGAASLLVRLDPSAMDGAAVADQNGLARVLDGVLLDVAPVALDAGWFGPVAADALAVLAKGAPNAPLAFHMDPISAFAEAGSSPGPVEAHVAAAANTAARHAPAYPRATAFLASGRVVHEALGSEAQELAFATAAALAYAKAQVSAGLTLAEAFERIVLGLSADGTYFVQIAKLRAARLLWARLTEACGAPAPAQIEARSSRRMLAKVDPWVNMLRLTAAGFAAGVGGADAVVLEPFTRPLGFATDFARRQARNTQLILMEEASLGRVVDPAAGSAFVERLTEDLARAAWAEFQAIEAEGGLVAALRTGRLQAAVARVAEARRADVASEAAPLLGVTLHPNPDEAAVATEAVDRAALALSLDPPRLPGPDDACAALRPERLAEPYEGRSA